MSDGEYLEKLREITSRLVSNKEIMVRPENDKSEVMELKLESGRGTAHGLFKNKDAAIAVIFCTAGSVYPMSMHDEHEVVGVISGCFEVKYLSGSARTLGKYEHLYLPPNTPHSFEFIEDTWLWIVTMPAALEFPDAGEDKEK